MQREDFTSSAPGRLVSTAEGFPAFVPNPLPPALELTWEDGMVIADATLALGRLAEATQHYPDPQLFIRPFLRQDAVLSSRIEGTRADLADLVLFEATPNTANGLTEDVREVNNYLQALDLGLTRLHEGVPFGRLLIRELHAVLLDGVRGSDPAPGQFRTRQNYIGPPGCTQATATYIGPPVFEMGAALQALEAYSLIPPQSLPPLVKLALIHYQFEAIHPFNDGNGRIGRLILPLLLNVWGILPRPILYLAGFFESHRQQYYQLLLGVSQQGAWWEWIRFFLHGVKVQSTDALNRVQRMATLRAGLRAQLLSVRETGGRMKRENASVLLLQLLDELFRNPAVTVAQVTERLAITPRAAQQNIDKLISSEILKEVTGRQRNRIFVCPQILRLIDPIAAQRFENPPHTSITNQNDPVIECARKIVSSLKEMDFNSLADRIHPEYGVRFTPYGYVDFETDQVMSSYQLREGFLDNRLLQWGYYDATGDPIRRSFAEYFVRFVYDKDYTAAQVSRNQRLGQGNSVDNSAEAYPGAEVIEFYAPGSEEFKGFDWSSLRVVLKSYEGDWYLVGLIHDEWTV